MRPPLTLAASFSSPSPTAALVLDGLHAVLCEDRCVERIVKRSLRAGSRSGTLASNDARASAAEALFGVSMLRLRLSHLLAQVEPAAGVPGMLALYLLHETPARTAAEVLARELAVESVGLPRSTVARLRAFEPQTARWPEAPASRLAAQLSLPPRPFRLTSEVLHP